MIHSITILITNICTAPSPIPSFLLPASSNNCLLHLHLLPLLLLIPRHQPNIQNSEQNTRHVPELLAAFGGFAGFAGEEVESLGALWCDQEVAALDISDPVRINLSESWTIDSPR